MEGPISQKYNDLKKKKEKKKRKNVTIQFVDDLIASILNNNI